MDQVCRLLSATCSLQKANKTNTVQVSVQLRRMFFLLIGYILGANLYTWSFQIAISWISPAKYRTPIQHKGSWHVCLVSRNRKANAALPSLVASCPIRSLLQTSKAKEGYWAPSQVTTMAARPTDDSSICLSSLTLTISTKQSFATRNVTALSLTRWGVKLQEERKHSIVGQSVCPRSPAVSLRQPAGTGLICLNRRCRNGWILVLSWSLDLFGSFELSIVHCLLLSNWGAQV
jgi:hypothetical protein